jgi:preprotein translocase subunit SecG
MSILLGILTFVLIVISLFLILVVLAQKAKNDGGMGAAMGGGMAEAAFGADTTNVLSKATINASIAFFVLAFGLYLGRIYQRTHGTASGADALPTIAAPATKAPTATNAPAANPAAPAAQPQPAAPAAPAKKP